MTLLAALVAASDEVAATASRSKKIARLASLIASLRPDEVAPAVGFLSGKPRQGKIGVGWATAYGLEASGASEATLEIADLDDVIDRVEATTGAGSVAGRGTILGDLLARATVAEVDFVRRLFVGELRQGALAGIVTDAVAKAAGVATDLVRRANMLSGDLPAVAEVAITSGEDGLRTIGFEIFRPIVPMLASTASDVAAAMSSFDLASVEWKLDGIRMQVHRSGGEVRAYSRGLNDITGHVPEVIEAVRGLDVSSVVLDGEAIGGVASYIFDVLHVDGEDLLDRPLGQRLEILDRIAPGLRIPGVVTSDEKEAESVLDAALEAGHEGVVVKDVSSAYVAGRRGKAWRKVKPVNTYDLVVLGADWGHGRRKGWLSNIHLGARDEATGEFLMVGKCFKGMTDELLRWQTEQILAREVSREGISVFARPELVVEIALDGVFTSKRYESGIALRFARVKRYRPDKPAEKADTLETLGRFMSE